MSDPSVFTIAIDTREQTPLDFSPFVEAGLCAVVRKRLTVGDYSIVGFERNIFCERKSLNDLVNTLTHGSMRFTREIYDRGVYAASRLLVVEADWSEISRPYSFSMASPQSIVNRLFSFTHPPVPLLIQCSRSRPLQAWYVFNWFKMFVHCVSHSRSGFYRAFFAPDAADIPAIAHTVRDTTTETGSF